MEDYSRSDLACESGVGRLRETAGIQYREEHEKSCRLERMRVLTADCAERLGKPLPPFSPPSQIHPGSCHLPGGEGGQTSAKDHPLPLLLAMVPVGSIHHRASSVPDLLPVSPLESGPAW